MRTTTTSEYPDYASGRAIEGRSHSCTPWADRAALHPTLIDPSHGWPFGVRGARNTPCETVPGKRAATVRECESDQQHVPLNDGFNWKGDPNATLSGQGVPQLPPGSAPPPGATAPTAVLPTGGSGCRRPERPDLAVDAGASGIPSRTRGRLVPFASAQLRTQYGPRSVPRCALTDSPLRERTGMYGNRPAICT